MYRLSVFCGSGDGNPASRTAAQEIGRLLAENQIELVYGGANIGLMGLIADAVLSAGGKVTGVMPRFLQDKEIAHQSLTKLEIVESMHERKSLMAELADGFIALPGGYGTVEEFLEVVTWAKLGLHKKPCGLLNSQGFYDYLLSFFDVAAQHKFISEVDRNLIVVSSSASELVSALIKKMRDRGSSLS